MPRHHNQSLWFCSSVIMCYLPRCFREAPYIYIYVWIYLWISMASILILFQAFYLSDIPFWRSYRFNLACILTFFWHQVCRPRTPNLCAHWRLRLRVGEDEEEEEEEAPGQRKKKRRKRRMKNQGTLIIFIDPHLAGGEKYSFGDVCQTSCFVLRCSI